MPTIRWALFFFTVLIYMSHVYSVAVVVVGLLLFGNEALTCASFMTRLKRAVSRKHSFAITNRRCLIAWTRKQRFSVILTSREVGMWSVCLPALFIGQFVLTTPGRTLLQQEQHQLISRKLNCFDFPSDERINKSLTGSSCLLRWHTRKNMPLNITMPKAFDPCPPLLLLGILLMTHSSTL